MRVLSFKQPWAQLICLGLKDAEGRSWDTPYRGKILIHASSAKPTKNFLAKCYDEDACEIANAITMGNLPEPKTLPTSAIIGYVTVKDIVDECDSIWGYPNMKNWILEDAYLFDEPINGVNGKLNLWNYDEIDENNLPPAHKAEIKHLELKGKNLTVPLNEDDFDEAMEKGFVKLEMSEEVYDVCFNDDGVEDIETITIESPTRKALISVGEYGAFPQEYENGEKIKVITKSGEETQLFLFIVFFHQLLNQSQK